MTQPNREPKSADAVFEAWYTAHLDVTFGILAPREEIAKAAFRAGYEAALASPETEHVEPEGEDWIERAAIRIWDDEEARIFSDPRPWSKASEALKEACRRSARSALDLNRAPIPDVGPLRAHPDQTSPMTVESERLFEPEGEVDALVAEADLTAWIGEFYASDKALAGYTDADMARFLARRLASALSSRRALSREEVARIIAPSAFYRKRKNRLSGDVNPADRKSNRERALAKADAILSRVEGK